MDEESDIYVCISHISLVPCSGGEFHLVSNWPPDVINVLNRIESKK